ncbi:MAG: hypothetical protein ABI748_12125 [Dokdonella sp.]
MHTPGISPSDVTRRLDNLERQNRRLRMALFAGASIIIIALLCAFTANDADRVLRARGIEIVDATGHERILIGAPPPADGRKRKDGQTASIVVLGPDGSDRVILGEEPNPIINGKTYPRIDAAYGLLIHDKQGSERGGVSAIDNGRGVISLDRPGIDAVEMVVNDKTGFAGLTVNYARPMGEYAEAIRLGTKGREAWWALSDENSKERARLSIDGDSSPAMRTFPADKSNGPMNKGDAGN